MSPIDMLFVIACFGPPITDKSRCSDIRDYVSGTTRPPTGLFIASRLRFFANINHKHESRVQIL